MQDQTIVKRKLADEIRDRILKMIEGGELRPGDQLPSERDLMSRYKVGRPAVREALQSLARMGLIEISHGERARVVLLDASSLIDQISRPARHLLQTTPNALEHLKDARLMFEVGMARIAAQRATPDDLNSLEQALARQRAAWREGASAAPKGGGITNFVKADMAFHTAIAAIGGNPLCAALSQAMLQWLCDFHNELLRVPGAEQVTLSEHQEIFDRIAAHDPKGAEDAMTRHLTRAGSVYRVPEIAAANSFPEGTEAG
jgi:GntR family transcriptional regulator, sialic acid-inducible nan operon repressor